MKVIKNWFDINKKNSAHLLKMNNKDKHIIYMFIKLNIFFIFLNKNFTHNIKIIVDFLIILIKVKLYIK